MGNMEVKFKDTIPTFSNVATTDEGVYKVSDGMYGGYSYYWRGAVTNNYVEFAGFCWRIIRINGDGSIRLIYDGTTCHSNGTSTTESIAVTSQKYNSSSDRSEYVGYTYIIGNQRTLGGTASNLKTQTDSWYTTNIIDKGYDAKVATGKFCNDRNIASGSTWSSQSSAFQYATYERLNNAKAPILSCKNSGDIYSLKSGAITADEISLAGGVVKKENNSYYLYNGQNYWTMSPYVWNKTYTYAYMYYMYINGSLNGNASTNSGAVYHSYGIRPVINLLSNTQFKSGTDGTLNNPYEVI